MRFIYYIIHGQVYRSPIHDTVITIPVGKICYPTIRSYWRLSHHITETTASDPTRYIRRTQYINIKMGRYTIVIHNKSVHAAILFSTFTHIIRIQIALCYYEAITILLMSCSTTQPIDLIGFLYTLLDFFHDPL